MPMRDAGHIVSRKIYYIFGGDMKNFCLITCLLILALSQQIVHAQQLQVKEDEVPPFI